MRIRSESWTHDLRDFHRARELLYGYFSRRKTFVLDRFIVIAIWFVFLEPVPAGYSNQALVFATLTAFVCMVQPVWSEGQETVKMFPERTLVIVGGVVFTPLE